MMKIFELVRATNKPNYKEAQIPIPSNIRVENWLPLLQDYKDKDVILFLKYGFPITYDSESPPVPTFQNHQSAIRFQKHVDNFVESELKYSALIGPFIEPPFEPWCQISPLLTRDKKDSENRRVIIDLSFPENHSVNDGIPKNIFEGEFFGHNLPTIGDFIDLMKKNGRSCFMWKCDLRRAYRQLRLDPFSYPLLGIQNKGQYFIDICPSFGCRSSGGCQQRVSEAVVHVMKQKYNTDMLVYVDDFGCISNTLKRAQHSFLKFQQLCEHLGLELSPEKSVPPTQIIEWLGFEFNSVDMTLNISEKKLSELMLDCQKWESMESASKKDLQHIAGKLNHVSQAIFNSRKFMSRILDTLRSAPASGTIPLGQDFKLDIRWFLECAAEANCTRLIQPVLRTVLIECDACLQGAGGWCKQSGKVFNYKFPDHFTNNYHITQLEALNIVVAIKTFIPEFTSPHRFLIHTDNEAAMFTINSGRTRDPILAACAREVALIAAQRQATVELVHVPGISLTLVDALSRRHVSSRHNFIAMDIATKHNLTFVSPHPVKFTLSPV